MMSDPAQREEILSLGASAKRSEDGSKGNDGIIEWCICAPGKQSDHSNDSGEKIPRSCERGYNVS